MNRNAATVRQSPMERLKPYLNSSVPSVNLRQARAAAAPRAASREGFNGARLSRLDLDWVTSSLPLDEQIRWDLRHLRARARDLSQNTPQGKHYRNLLMSNVVGPTGFKLQAKTRMGDGADAELDRETNRLIEKAWRAWGTTRVTVDRRLCFVDFLNLVVKTLATDGEVFIRRFIGFDNAYRYALQLIDADLVDERLSRTAGVDGNEIRMGVEVDGFGAPVAYWVNTGTVFDVNSQSGRRTRIPAEEIIHLYVNERPNQTRGVPWFAPVMARLKMLDGYTEAELVAARTGAAKMGFIQSKDGAVISMPDAEDGTNPNAPMVMEGNPGTIEQLQPGWEFSAWDPNHPSGAFGDFVKTVLRDIWSGLGVSYNAGANDLENVNYSSMRSGLLIERDIWRMLQNFMVVNVLSPIYTDWLNTALLSGALRLSGQNFQDYAEVSWIPRGWAWVDPLKETQAGVLGMSNGLASRTRLLAEQGLDLDETFEELAEELELAKEMGIELASSQPPAPAPGQPGQPGQQGAAPGAEEPPADSGDATD